MRHLPPIILLAGTLLLSGSSQADPSLPAVELPAGAEGEGTCPFSGQPSPQRVVWATSY